MKRALLFALLLAGLLGCQEERTWDPVWKSLSTPRQGVAAVEVDGFSYAMGSTESRVVGSREYAA